MNNTEFKKIREAGNFSAETLAEKLGVSIRSIYRYEDGTRKISKPIEKLMVGLTKPKFKIGKQQIKKVG